MTIIDFMTAVDNVLKCICGHSFVTGLREMKLELNWVASLVLDSALQKAREE